MLANFFCCDGECTTVTISAVGGLVSDGLSPLTCLGLAFVGPGAQTAKAVAHFMHSLPGRLFRKPFTANDPRLVLLHIQRLLSNCVISITF